MNTNQTLLNKSNYRVVCYAALVLGIMLCLSNAEARPGRGVGAGARGVGPRPGPGVGGVPMAAARLAGPVGVGVVGPAVLPAGYHRTVAAGYTVVAYAGYSCRFVGGVYYRPATYQGETVWVVVK